MVDAPAPDDAIGFDYDRGENGMPESTIRAFKSHYNTQLAPSGQIEKAIREIERVYAADPDAVVAVSGGKDSMVALALAAAADIGQRALHFDWGRRFVPRDLEQAIVENVREYVPTDRLYVATDARAVFEPLDENDHFRRYLNADPGGDAYEGVSGLAAALRRCDSVGRQLVGLRSSESGGRERKLDASGLYGQSLGQPAAFPIRDWSARDVWAYIVEDGVPYPDHYDAVAKATGDGGPECYERARFTTVFDPEFEELSAASDGVAHWRDRDLEQP